MAKSFAAAREHVRFYSIKSVILLVFVIAIVFCIAAVTVFSYADASRQLRKNFYANMNDVLAQTRNALNSRFSMIIQEMYDFLNDDDTFAALLQATSYRVTDEEAEEIAILERNMRKTLVSHFSVLDSIFVYFNNGRIHHIEALYGYTRQPFDFPSWWARVRPVPTDYTWVNMRQNEFLARQQGTSNIASVAKVFCSADSSFHGIIAFNLRESFFREILANPGITGHGYLAIISPDGIMAFKDAKHRPELDAEWQKIILDHREPSGMLRTEAGATAVTILHTALIPDSWRLAAVFPEREIGIHWAYGSGSNLFILGVSIVLIAALYVFLTQTITRPLSVLAAKVGRLRHGDLSVDFDVSGKNEIGVLNEGLRLSLEKVRQLLAEIEERKEREKQAELDLMQSQVKPHFLYNTLQSISELCDQGSTQAASRMVTSLARFCRLSLGAEHRITTIEEEVNHIRNYLLIQQMRYREVFDYDLSVSSEILRVAIVKFSLQPLVENSIYHGVKLKRGGGMVRVTGWSENGDAYIEVFDDGAGMTEQRLAGVRESFDKKNTVEATGIGLVNVHARLNLSFGDPYGLTVESETNVGTRVVVRIPAR